MLSVILWCVETQFWVLGCWEQRPSMNGKVESLYRSAYDTAWYYIHTFTVILDKVNNVFYNELLIVWR